MYNIDEIIEKYRKELVDFSKQSSSAEEIEYDAAVPAVAQVTDLQNRAQEQTKIFLPRKYKDYDTFRDNNTSAGTLKVQVFAGSGSFPVGNAFVTVSVPLESGNQEIYSGYTGIDGIVDDIVLPAPNVRYSLDENNKIEPFSVYNIKVTHPNYASAEFDNVPVFDSIKSIQPVELVPLTETGRNPDTVIIPNQPMNLFGGENG